MKRNRWRVTVNGETYSGNSRNVVVAGRDLRVYDKRGRVVHTKNGDVEVGNATGKVRINTGNRVVTGGLLQRLRRWLRR